MSETFGLSKNAVDELEKALFSVLANTHILYVKTLNYHWNVEDPSFLMYHELFEGQYKALAESVDAIAERIRMMGRTVNGSLKAFLEASSRAEAKQTTSAREMVQDLAEDHEAAIVSLRVGITLAEKHNDPGTADFLTELLQGHEKTAWFLRSHIS